MSEIKSPLRYPGGKSRAIQRIDALLLKDFEEYREPFVGGGSLFIYLKQKRPSLKIWINDLNLELYYFWKYAQIDSEKFAEEVLKIKKKSRDGNSLFNELVNANISKWTAFDRALRFFVLNRITFSGLAESGGYSKLAFETRFTLSSIDRLAKIGQVLEGIKITHKDYKELLKDNDKAILSFLDPPYFKAVKSKLYGKNGVLHTKFDHDEFAQRMRACKHSWLITYDDSLEIREKFSYANIYIHEWQLQYGMNNYKQGNAGIGREIFISNYPPPIS